MFLAESANAFESERISVAQLTVNICNIRECCAAACV